MKSPLRWQIISLILLFWVGSYVTAASASASKGTNFNLEQSATLVQAPICPGGGMPQDIYSQGFEGNLDGWSITSLNSKYGSVNGWERLYGVGSVGNYALYGRDYQGSEANPIQEGLEIAAATGSISLPAEGLIYLRFDHLFGFELPDYDGGLIQFSVGGGGWQDLDSRLSGGAGYNGTIFLGFGNPNEGEDGFIGESGGYVSSRYSLTGLSGQDVAFRWVISVDSDFYDHGWLLDEVRVYQCTSSTWADFDGDGDTDITIFRPTNARWYTAGQGLVTYGIPGDHPIPGDYDGDGDYDQAVYRPSTSRWYIYNQASYSYGIPGDIPMQCDWDGDGDTDIGLYRPSNGRWYMKDIGMVTLGISGDIPVPADYDGDGNCDAAVYRPGTGVWYIYGQAGVPYGIAGDIPIPGDWDGDGDADIAIFRPSNGRWYVFGQGLDFYGISGDIPIPADYDGDGDVDIAVYRPSTGYWYVKDQFGMSYGIPGDYPVMVRDTNLDGDVYE